MHNGMSKIVKLMIVLVFSFWLLPIGELQADDIAALTQQLDNKDRAVRLNAVMALGETKDARAVEPLIALLGDESCGCTAAKALATIGKPSVKPLIANLKDENPIVRRNAAMALGDIKDNDATEPLIETLNDENAFVRMNAAKALGSIKDDRAVKPLVTALEDENPVVRKHVALALEEIGDPSVRPLIVDILY